MNFTGFGEILFDVFGETEILGGAPLNVASHISRLGGQCTVISALGKDRLGEKALQEIKNRNISVEEIALLGSFPTGVAEIKLVNKDADYTFNTPCAWDRIECQKKIVCDVFYFGSLAQRSQESRQTLHTLLDSISAKYIFFDVNLRKGFYSKEILEKGCQVCSILKVNEEELGVFSKIFALKAKSDKTLLQEISQRFAIPVILLTKGKEGAFCYAKGQLYYHETQDVKVVDTVGAGDGFSAGFLFGFAETGDVKESLRLGSRLADFIVTRQGAVPYYEKSMFLKI
jgi:fructokinase